jgi:hypothetical protein
MATATYWEAGTNAFKGNLTSPNSSSSTMSGPGANGTDIGISVYLGGTRTLWLWGDTFWHPSGVTRGTNLRLIRNPVSLQTGSLDLSTATMTWYWGNSASDPVDFFPPVMRDGQPMWKYPLGGIFLDDRILVTGMLSYADSGTLPVANFGTTMTGMWATMLYDVSGNNPNSWAQQDLKWGGGHDSFHVERQFTPACNPVDGGDGFVYFYCFGPSWGAMVANPWSGAWSVFRIPRDDVKKGDLTRPRWFDGANRWVEDYRDVKTGALARNRPNVLGFSINGSDQLGGVHKRSDGQWQLTCIPSGWFGAAPHVGYSLAASPASKFSTYTKLWDASVQSGYTPPNGGHFWTQPKQAELDAWRAANPGNNSRNGEWGDFVYGAYSYPEQTWSGKGANDQLIGFSRNRGGPGAIGMFSDSRAYWCEFYKVTGI